MKRYIMLLSICVGHAFGYNVKIHNTTRYPFEITIHYKAPFEDSTKQLFIESGKVATQDYAAYCIKKIEAAILRKGNHIPMVRKTLHPEHTGAGVTCRDINVELSLEEGGDFSDFTIRET